MVNAGTWPRLLSVSLITGLVSCASLQPSPSQLALNKVSEAGGALTFRFLDETRAVRQDVSRALERGLVAVQVIDGNIREVYQGCFVGSTYEYQASTPAVEDHVADAKEELSLGVAGVQAEASAGTSVGTRTSIRLVTVGRFSGQTAQILPARPARCSAATHLLAEVEVGAFEIEHAGGSQESVGLGALVAASLSSANVSKDSSRLQEGHWATCEQSSPRAVAPADACRVPLRARIVPLTESAENEVRHDPEQALAGRFSCGGRGWRLTMVFRESSGSSSGSVRVTSVDEEDEDDDDEDDMSGEWSLLGTKVSDGYLLRPVEPMSLPPGYGPVTFIAQVHEGALVGLMTGVECGSVAVALEE
jgi:hypothetical protein